MGRLREFPTPLRRAWPRIFARISETPQNRRWRHTHGLIWGIIAMLLDHGWDAPHPEQWTFPERTTFLLSEPDLLSDPGPLFRYLEASLWADFWLAADCGYCGLGLAGGCDMTVLRRQWNETNPTPKPQACCSIRLLAGTGFARKHAAHLVESAHRDGGAQALGVRAQQHHRPHTHFLQPPGRLATPRTCPALWMRGLVPAQFLHKFPIPEDTLLFGCKEAATNDITAPRHGERSSVAFKDASTGRHASDTRHRRVGTAAIILAFTGAEWSDIEKLSMQQLLDKTAPAQHDADEDEAKHLTEPLSRRLEKPSRCGQAGCKRSLGHRKRRQEASFGHSLSPSHILTDPSCTTPIIWGSFRGSTQTATFPRLGHSRNYGHASAPSSPAEAHR